MTSYLLLFIHKCHFTLSASLYNHPKTWVNIEQSFRPHSNTMTSWTSSLAENVSCNFAAFFYHHSVVIHHRASDTFYQTGYFLQFQRKAYIMLDKLYNVPIKKCEIFICIQLLFTCYLFMVIIYHHTNMWI